MVKDKANQEIMSATRMNSGAGEFSYTTSASNYSLSGSQIESRMPNYYSKEGSNQKRFVSIHTKDPLGHPMLREEPDMQPNRAIYDSAGRLRFSQADQDGAPADRSITYLKYDSLGRVIEGGTYPYDWNDSTDAASSRAG